MPTISEFFGILIRMYYDEESPPHFHAIYGDFEMRVLITRMHRIPRVEKLKVLDDYKLELIFDDGKIGIFDMKPIIFKGGKAVEPLKDPAVFRKARADLGVEWDTDVGLGFGLSPEVLYKKVKEITLV